MNLVLDRPDTEEFFNTLPADPDRERRADALRAAAQTFAATAARKRDLGTRQQAAAAAFVWDLASRAHSEQVAA